MLERARCTQSPSPLPLPFPSPSSSSLPIPFNGQSSIGRRSSRPRRRRRRRRCTGHRGASGSRGCHCGGVPLLWARSRRRCWPSIVVTLRCLAPTSMPPSLYRPSCPANGPHPAMRTRRRRAPAGPAAGSPGLDKAAPGVADIKHSSLRKAMQRRHAAASRTSRNRS